MKKQLTFLAIAMTALTSVHANEETQFLPVEPSTLTRAEVSTDLAAWRNAGLTEVSRGENTPDIYSTEYRRQEATYKQSLRVLNAANRKQAQ